MVCPKMLLFFEPQICDDTLILQGIYQYWTLEDFFKRKFLLSSTEGTASDYGIYATKFLEIARRGAIPTEIIQLYILYLQSFLKYFKSETQYLEATWIEPKVLQYITELEQCMGNE